MARKDERRGREKDREKTARAARARTPLRAGRVRLERRNLLLLGGGLLSILLGYLALSQGSLSLAPLLLVLGYCFLVPISLLWRTREPDASPAGGVSRRRAPSSDGPGE